jgi:excisionase family DNA binding protein
MDDDIIHAADAKKGSPFLTTAQAAHYLGLSRPTLEKMRRRGVGPCYRKHGRYVRYHIADLDAWSDSRSRNATREADGQPPVKRGGDGKSDA